MNRHAKSSTEWEAEPYPRATRSQRRRRNSIPSKNKKKWEPTQQINLHAKRKRERTELTSEGQNHTSKVDLAEAGKAAPATGRRRVHVQASPPLLPPWEPGRRWRREERGRGRRRRRDMPLAAGALSSCWRALMVAPAHNNYYSPVWMRSTKRARKRIFNAWATKWSLFVKHFHGYV